MALFDGVLLFVTFGVVASSWECQKDPRSPSDPGHCGRAVESVPTPATVERWDQYEVSLAGPSDGNPFVDVTLSAIFNLTDRAKAAAMNGCVTRSDRAKACEMPTTVAVDGFYNGGSSYKIRFSPPYAGTWTFVTTSSAPTLNGKHGSFEAVPPSAGNHGPVHSEGFRLVHADGTAHFSVGSTSYQWSSKGIAMQEQTLQTLAQGQGDGPVFNKQRMTIFPKWYSWNHANPVEAGAAYEIKPGSVAANTTAWECVGPDCPSTDGSFDLTRFNVSYWQQYERLLHRMKTIGVVADIIVFHPYDSGHWGFDCMGGRDGAMYNTSHDNFYLRYLGARLSSFSNVWWAMANEWNFCKCKSYNTTQDGPTPVWDELFHTLAAADPYGRQTSIHNGNLLYNHSRPWITHVSLQGHEDDTPILRSKYHKPVIWDEVRYEGNVTSSWGALSAEEMADRFWSGASRGVYVGHSETVLRGDLPPDSDSQPLWWAKGGTLVGRSPARILWFRSLWDHNTSRPEFSTLIPSQEYLNDHSHASFAADMLSSGARDFFALHFSRPGLWTIPLPPPSKAATGWVVRSLDYWAQTVDIIATLPADAVGATIDVASLPANYEIVRVGSSWRR